MRDETLLRSTAARYAFSVAAVAAAFALKILLMPWTGSGPPLVFAFAAILVTSIFAGPGPAVLALVITVPLGALILPAGYSDSQALVQASLYLIDGLIIVYLTSLTNRRRVSLQHANQRLLTANQERARALTRTRETIDLAPDAYFLADLDGHLSDVNQAACRLLAYTREELVRKSLFDIIPPEDVARLAAARADLMVPGRIHKSEWLLRRKDGRFVPVEASANILHDGRWQGFIRDISAARRVAREREEHLAREQLARQEAELANAQLRESEERFRLAFEESPLGAALIGLDGRFERVNQVLCEITGYAADELSRLTVNDVTHPDDVDNDLELLAKLNRSEIRRYQVEKHYIRKDRTVVIIVLSVSVLRAPDGTPQYYIVRIEDITDRRRAEEALRRAVTARDDVLGIVAHDLRNPLSTIMMQAEMLERTGPEGDRRDQTGRRVIMRSAHRMNRLIQDLLDVAVVEAGHVLRITRANVPVAALVLDAAEMQRPLALAAGIDLRVAIEQGPQDLFIDRDRLLQVFSNLIGNALKFTPKGGHISIGAALEDKEVAFSVADSGAGIAPENLLHVFDRFWQASKRAGRLGAGLGLPITKGIVEAHGGRVWVESAIGGGTTFFFAIPTATADGVSARPRTHPEALRTKRRPRPEKEPS